MLRNPPLSIVALELRFPEAFLLPENLKEIRKGLVKEYPVSDTEQGVGIEISVGGVRQQPTIERHVYRTRDGAHTIALTSTSLVLEGRGGTEYEGFEHFLERWLVALDVVQRVAEIDTQIRLGLRYVNQLPVEDASGGLEAVRERINTALLSPLGADGFGFGVTRSFQELRLANAQGKATLRHGLQIPQDDAAGPAAYILDIDFYDDEIADYERERQVEKLKTFNLEIWNIFRWSITDQEYDRMQPEER